MTTDAQALAIALRALPQEPRAALHLALVVSREETHYSDTWGPNILPGGANPNNWGAVQATEMGQPAFAHLDHHRDGTPYMGAYRVNPTPEAGFKQAAANVLRPDVLAAAEEGNGTAAIYAMHANGYFELDPAVYARKAAESYQAFLANTGEPALLSFDLAGASESSSASEGAGGLVLLALAVGAAWLSETLKPAAKGGKP